MKIGLADHIRRTLRVPYTLHVRQNRLGTTRQTVLFLHGLGGTGDIWDPIIDLLPQGVSIVTIDLLGFGRSPKPSWAEFNVKTQARSIAATFLKHRIIGPVIIVGHSMGALVAVELARKYPRIVKGLVLCNPPFYKSQHSKRPTREKQLHRLYEKLIEHPDKVVALSQLAIKHKFIHKGYDVSAENIEAYIGALEASVINQTSLDDAKQLRQKMHIVHGKFDPVVIAAYLQELKRYNPNVRLHSVIGAHEVKGKLIDATVAAIQDVVGAPGNKG